VLLVHKTQTEKR